jgi:hypothetical protein
MYQHKVFKGYAARGKSSTGGFTGLHCILIINDRGELCALYLSQGNVDDRNPAILDHLCHELWGKLFGDQGYISQELFERMYRQGIQRVTRLRKHMKNKLMEMDEKVLLRKRAVIESVNDFLKHICPIEQPVRGIVSL